MDLHLRAFWRSTEWEKRFFQSTILLTGATGFLGTHLLFTLLTTTQVFLLFTIILYILIFIPGAHYLFN